LALLVSVSGSGKTTGGRVVGDRGHDVVVISPLILLTIFRSLPVSVFTWRSVLTDGVW
jgi:hypothetical protein